MWPIYLLGLSWLLPTVPMTQYLTLVLKDAGYGTFETNLLTIPAYCFFIRKCAMIICSCEAETCMNLMLTDKQSICCSGSSYPRNLTNAFFSAL